MGNTPSNSSSGVGRGNLRRRNIPKNELDKLCEPSGLYPTCPWEARAIRRLVGDGRLAPRLSGKDARSSPLDRECPICFLHYSKVNTTLCCQANICTECYLQVRPQKEPKTVCPFCNHAKFQIGVANDMKAYDIQRREEEEQRVIEATIKARNENELSASDHSSEGGNRERSGSDFGRFVLQSQNSFTEEDRLMLEDQMRAQHTHPLTRRMEQEAEERRSQNERNYYRNQGVSLSMSQRHANPRSRFSRISSDTHILHSSTSSSGSTFARRYAQGDQNDESGRDWNQIVQAFERGSGGQVQSLDDLVVIEAAILLSMEEEAARREEGGGNNEAGANEDSDHQSDFDPAEHAEAGFPLVRPALVRHLSDDSSTNSSRTLESFAHRRARYQRSTSSRPYAGPESHTHSSNRIYMSEEDQVAVAIAMSLRQAERERQKAEYMSGDLGAVSEDASEHEEETAEQETETRGGDGGSGVAARAADEIHGDEEQSNDSKMPGEGGNIESAEGA